MTCQLGMRSATAAKVCTRGGHWNWTTINLEVAVDPWFEFRLLTQNLGDQKEFRLSFNFIGGKYARV